MGLLSTIGKAIFGAGATGAVDIATGVDAIVDKHVATVRDKMQFTKDLGSLVEQSVSNARGFAAPGVHNTSFDAFVDGINRLVRPGMAIAVLGDWLHWWHLQDVSTLSPMESQLVWTVVGFYFGGRMLTQDVPQAVAFLWTAIRKS